VCLPCDVCILGGFSGCFSGFFLVSFGLFRPGVVRAPLIKILKNDYLAYKLVKKMLKYRVSWKGYNLDPT
jgi:hypothetical protein